VKASLEKTILSIETRIAKEASEIGRAVEKAIKRLHKTGYDTIKARTKAGNIMIADAKKAATAEINNIRTSIAKSIVPNDTAVVKKTQVKKVAAKKPDPKKIAPKEVW